ncbi:MAG: hypothetical protein U0L26_01355 [Cellulosilyticum sp.]|nr:hypothetical protein [Cellulosilyticum sp.]MEE1071032.1 hypothetical protein [Cellulosilyticum sp.]
MIKDECQKDLDELNALDSDIVLFDDHQSYEGLDEDGYDEYDYDDDDVYDFSMPKESSAGSWTSLVLGIISSLGWIVPIIGLPITIVGTVFGAINIRNKKSRGVAIAGFVINIVFLCASIAKGIVDIVMYARKNRK